MENNRKRPQDEVPYEVIVSYIIRDYRRNLQSLEMLEPYTRQLEEVVRQQQQELQEARKAKKENESLSSELKQAQIRINELTEHLHKLKEEEADELGQMRFVTKRALANRIEQLEQYIMSYGLNVPKPDRNIRQFIRAKQLQQQEKDGADA